MHKYLLIVSLLFANSLTTAQNISLASPESVGMSGERIAKIGKMLEEFVDNSQVPGFVTLIARYGKIVHWESHGFREMGSSEPMPKDAIFELASMTKPVTVVSALMQFEEGRFLMYEPISNHLPEFASPRVINEQGSLEPANREITPHDLFTHTSGVRDSLSRVEKYGHETLADYMKHFAQQPLRAHPGERFLYGDSHDVLGYLAQVVSAQRLDHLWQEKIFDPLQMNDSHFWLPGDKEARRAILYRNGKNDPDMNTRYPPEAAERRTFITGAGGLHMTALDYWKFTQMLLNGGESNGHRFLSPKTIQWMTENHIGDLPRPNAAGRNGGIRVGLGVGVVTDASQYDHPISEGTYFWGGALGTAFWIDPQEELIGIIMAQVAPNNNLDYQTKFRTMVYAAVIEPNY